MSFTKCRQVFAGADCGAAVPFHLCCLHFRNEKLWTFWNAKLSDSTLRECSTMHLLSWGRLEHPSLIAQATERLLRRDSDKSTVYTAEIDMLIQTGYIKKLSLEKMEQSTEAWYLPNHVCHNNKPCLVFRQWFRQHQVAVSSDIH